MELNITQLKQYGWSFLGAMGVVFFWTGIWGGIANLIPGFWYIPQPAVLLVVGLCMLIGSGVFFKALDPLKEEEKQRNVVLDQLSRHPLKHEFNIKYYDKVSKKHVLLEAKQLKTFENSHLVFDVGGQEVFVPAHRIKEVLHKGKSYWRST